MPVDEKEVRHIARLARLGLNPSDVARLREDLSSVLDYVALLDEVDPSELDAAAGGAASGPAPHLRADEPAPCLAIEEALHAAPDAARGLFRVPRVLGRTED